MRSLYSTPGPNQNHGWLPGAEIITFIISARNLKSMNFRFIFRHIFQFFGKHYTLGRNQGVWPGGPWLWEVRVSGKWKQFHALSLILKFSYTPRSSIALETRHPTGYVVVDPPCQFTLWASPSCLPLGMLKLALAFWALLVGPSQRQL